MLCRHTDCQDLDHPLSTFFFLCVDSSFTASSFLFVTVGVGLLELQNLPPQRMELDEVISFFLWFPFPRDAVCWSMIYSRMCLSGLSIVAIPCALSMSPTPLFYPPHQYRRRHRTGFPFSWHRWGIFNGPPVLYPSL